MDVIWGIVLMHVNVCLLVYANVCTYNMETIVDRLGKDGKNDGHLYILFFTLINIKDMFCLEVAEVSFSLS